MIAAKPSAPTSHKVQIWKAGKSTSCISQELLKADTTTKSNAALKARKTEFQNYSVVSDDKNEVKLIQLMLVSRIKSWRTWSSCWNIFLKEEKRKK